MYYLFKREKIFTADVSIYFLERFYILILEIYQAITCTCSPMALYALEMHTSMINFQLHSSQFKHPVLQLTARGKHPGFSNIHLWQDRRNNDGADRDSKPGLLNLLPGDLPIGQSGISIWLVWLSHSSPKSNFLPSKITPDLLPWQLSVHRVGKAFNLIRWKK